MQKPYLQFDTTLNDLEDQERWEDAISYLEILWKQEPSVDSLISVISEIWFVAAFCYGRSYYEGNKFETAKRMIPYVQVGLRDYADEPKFLAVVGWLMIIFPYFFGDYSEWEDNGKSMIKKAHGLAPADPVIAVLHDLLVGGPMKVYSEYAGKVWDTFSEEEWGQSAVQLYFRSLIQ